MPLSTSLAVHHEGHRRREFERPAAQPGSGGEGADNNFDLSVHSQARRSQSPANSMKDLAIPNTSRETCKACCIDLLSPAPKGEFEAIHGNAASLPSKAGIQVNYLYGLSSAMGTGWKVPPPGRRDHALK
jgi:hypothetical protein